MNDDDVFDALGSERRRELLVTLLEEESLEGVTARRDGGQEVTAHERRTQIAMYHRDLPKLEAYGFVRWDGDGEIGRGPRFEEIRPLLEFLADHAGLRPGMDGLAE